MREFSSSWKPETYKFFNWLHVLHKAKIMPMKIENLVVENDFIFKRQKSYISEISLKLLIFLPHILFKANNILHILYIKIFPFLTSQ